MAGRNSTSRESTKKAMPVIGPPPEGIDSDWETKVAIAKKVMKEAREARRGKPTTFKTHLMG